MNCRHCNTELTHVFCDLGHQPPSNSFLTRDQLDEPEVTYPLKVMVCDKCFLVQLPEIAKASEIFKEDYVYYSSQSPANVSHAKEYCDMMMDRFFKAPNDRCVAAAPPRVLEIGSNDGYMLQWFKEKGCSVQGCDPAWGPGDIARGKGIATWPGFFGTKTAEGFITFCELMKMDSKYDLICNINTLAHQPEINDFVEGMKIALAPNGVITCEFPHLMRLVEGCQFDTIYHEHYSYFSFTTIYNIFKEHGLDIFDVDELPEHGGSLRIYANHDAGYDRLTENVFCLLKTEQMIESFSAIEYYQDFQPKVDQIKINIVQFLTEKKDIGMTVAAYGAPAKGNTFLNYCGIRSDLIPYTVDRSPYKMGKYLPGSHIPVMDEEHLKKDKPDYVLILAWNLKEEIMEQLSYIREWGGKFVVAIPELEVI